VHELLRERNKESEPSGILRLRPIAHLLADKLLAGATEVACCSRTRIGRCARADHNTGILAVHGLRIATDETGGGSLRRKQWRRRQRGRL